MDDTGIAAIIKYTEQTLQTKIGQTKHTPPSSYHPLTPKKYIKFWFPSSQNKVVDMTA